MRILITFIFLLSSVFFTNFIYAADANIPTKKWTLLIYMNMDQGDYDPSGNDEPPDDVVDDEIKIMEKVGSTDKVNVVVQRTYIKAKYSVRMLIKRSANPDKVSSPIVQNLGYVDAGNYLTLQDFIDWGVQNYPAEHYFIVVNTHGNGWQKAGPQTDTKFYMGPNSYSGNEISSPQLGEVMRHAAALIGRKIDIYVSDACYMGDIETFSELADSVHLLIGSEDLESMISGSLHYDALLNLLALFPDSSAEQVAKTARDSLADTYQKAPYKDEQSTFVAINTDQFSVMINAMAKLANNIRAMKTTRELQDILTAETKSLSFSSGHFDLLDFIRELRSANLPSLDKRILDEIELSLNNAVLFKFINPSAYTDEDYKQRYQHAGGIGIWLAGQYIDPALMHDYHQLKFDVDTKWGETMEYATSKVG